MPQVTMSLAGEARRIGEVLISEHHPHLLNAEMLYVFTSQRRKRCDRVRLGSAGKLTALQRFLSSGMETVEAGLDFLVLLDEQEWVTLTDLQRRALIDHELCHCAVFVAEVQAGMPKTWRLFDPKLDVLDDADLEWRWGVRGHDVEEFADVLKRHGWWKPDAREKGFGELALQLPLTNGTVRDD